MEYIVENRLQDPHNRGVMLRRYKKMSKYCPVINQKVLYLTCLECEDKVCEKENLFVNNKVSGVSEDSILDINLQGNIIKG